MRHFYIVVDSMLLLKPFKFEQVNILLQWIADDTERILWSGNTFDGGLTPLSFRIHLSRNDLRAFSLSTFNGKLVAYGELVIKSDQVGTLCRVLVDPKARRRGYGKMLCEKLIDFAQQELKMKHLNLNTLSSNAAAISCYQSLGFHIIKTLSQSRTIGKKSVDLIIMGKDL